jgi:Coenzyme PQQ synthesis protein D (PqqD)
MASKKQTVISHPIARSERVVVEAVGDETVIYDLDTNVAHALKPLAAAVYMYADGKNTAAEIAELATYRLATTVTEADVAEALDQLEASALLATPLLDVHTGISRRTALKTFAAAGAGSMLVMSVATSAASACVTCTTVPSSSDSCVTGGGNGQAGTGDCPLCTTSANCGSDQVCCCTPCDGASVDCCQPVCYWKSTASGSSAGCPKGSLPLGTTKTGSIYCPSKYAQYNQSGYVYKCCEVGSSKYCPTEKNGICQ